jgi:hypothetical protein
MISKREISSSAPGLTFLFWQQRPLDSRQHGGNSPENVHPGCLIGGLETLGNEAKMLSSTLLPQRAMSLCFVAAFVRENFYRSFTNQFEAGLSGVAFSGSYDGEPKAILAQISHSGWLKTTNSY